DQLFDMMPNKIDPFYGARRVFDSLSQSYFIPNKEHTYLEIEEQVIAYVMHHNWGKIWVPDFNTKPKKKSKEAKEGIQLYHWYNEKKMKAERIESLIGFGPDADVEYRTIPIMDQGVIVGMKTE